MRPAEVTPQHLAEAMGLSLDKTWALAKNVDQCYKPRRMCWIGTKHRPIDALRKVPKQWFKRLHRFFQRERLYHRCAHGGVRKRSCFTSARLHVGQNFVWTRDASNCYPSITPRALFRELRSLGFRRDTAKLLTGLSTYQGAIPQGSPISGDVINLFFWRLNQAISSRAGKLGIRYGRVVDDFAFSGSRRCQADDLLEFLEAELSSRGITVNHSKKVELGVQDRSQELLVHNVSVSSPRGTSTNKCHRRTAFELAQKYLTASKSVSADSIQAVAARRRKLLGWISYSKQAEKSNFKALREHLRAGDRHVLERLRSLAIDSPKNKWWIVEARTKRDEPRRIARIWKKRLESAGV